MPAIGIMLYGYGEEDAAFIHEAVEEVLGEEVDLISAAGQEEKVVAEILERADSVNFEERDIKVMMVLGFSEEQLDTTLKGFPRREGLARPIFCVLTQHNTRWPLMHLIEDLLEERMAFKEMQRRQVEQG
ncbi:MAG: DUF3783 domain-containing protein [Thermoplasmata archaeon]|nr:DUF3783 domain-containing protein [Thermoplasmata archaeon]